MVKLKSSVDDALATWDNDVCSTGAVASGDTLCAVELTTMAMAAQTAETTMSYLTDATTPGYIGAPPDELTGIVADTKASAEKAGTSGKTVEADCPIGAATDACPGSAMVLIMAMEDLQTQLKAWSPYGVS